MQTSLLCNANKPSFEMKGFGAVGLTHKYEFKNELKQ